MAAELDFFIRRHRNWSGILAALLYAATSTISVNVFQNPGGIYAGGVTGLAQLIAAIVRQWLNVTLVTPWGNVSMTRLLSVGTLIFFLNVPLIILSWRYIGHHFTLFTILSVVCASLGLQLFPLHALTHDSMVCGIVGAVVSGLGTGFALRSNISTGGVDIVMLMIREKTGTSIGSINIIFNGMIVLTAGFLYGWQNAFISAFGIFISSRMIDAQYTRQQKVQAIIITEHPSDVSTALQQHMRHGITVIHGGEGAFDHQSRELLLTVISRSEYQIMLREVERVDPAAFVSSTPTDGVIGNFIDPRI